MTTTKNDPVGTIFIDGTKYFPVEKDGVIWYKPAQVIPSFKSFKRWVLGNHEAYHCKLITDDTLHSGYKNKCYLIFNDPSEKVYILNTAYEGYSSGSFNDLEEFYDFIMAGKSCYDINKMLIND